MSWVRRNQITATASVAGLMVGAALVVKVTGRQDDLVLVPVQQSAQAPQNVLFRSDWSTATGRGDAALRDTDKALPWNRMVGNGILNEVIPTGDLEFPSTNVLRIEAGWRASPPGAKAQTHRLTGGIPVPNTGESLFYRWYIRVVAPDTYTADAQTHPIQDALSRTNWEFVVTNNTNGTWNLTWSVGGNRQNPFPFNRWNLVRPLNKHQTYRVEMQVHRIGTSTFNLHARVYDSRDSLLYDDRDFTSANRSTRLSSTPLLQFTGLEELGGFQVGFNGLNGGGPANYPFVLYYQGCVAVCRRDWCGPYVVR